MKNFYIGKRLKKENRVVYSDLDLNAIKDGKYKKNHSFHKLLNIFLTGAVVLKSKKSFKFYFWADFLINGSTILYFIDHNIVNSAVYCNKSKSIQINKVNKEITCSELL